MASNKSEIYTSDSDDSQSKYGTPPTVVDQQVSSTVSPSPKKIEKPTVKTQVERETQEDKQRRMKKSLKCIICDCVNKNLIPYSDRYNVELRVIPAETHRY